MYRGGVKKINVTPAPFVETLSVHCCNPVVRPFACQELVGELLDEKLALARCEVDLEGLLRINQELIELYKSIEFDWKDKAKLKQVKAKVARCQDDLGKYQRIIGLLDYYSGVSSIQKLWAATDAECIAKSEGEQRIQQQIGHDLVHFQLMDSHGKQLLASLQAAQKGLADYGKDNKKDVSKDKDGDR